MAALVAHRSFLNDVLDRQSQRRAEIDPSHSFPAQPSISSSSKRPPPSDLDVKTKANVVNYVQEEETIRNDYTTWYGVSGQVGTNFILGANDGEICEEYPALKRLMDLKASQVDAGSHPPLYIQLASSHPTSLATALSPTRFDVILITPNQGWDETAALPIRHLSADPGFVFLWVGKGDEDGLERGRACFAKWGFRRAEDIVWVKTTKRRSASAGGQEEGTGGGGGLLASQKEHCLMGIRGTVRRSTDTRFVHCNVDTDVMVWEDSGEPDSPQYPPFLYTLIESFCLGTRRLQLFSPPSQSRRGWVSASTEPPVPESNTLPYDSATYPALLPEKQDGHDVLPFHSEIDMLRPKSPSRRGRPITSSSGTPSRGFPQASRGGRGGASRSSFGGQPGQQQPGQQQIGQIQPGQYAGQMAVMNPGMAYPGQMQMGHMMMMGQPGMMGMAGMPNIPGMPGMGMGGMGGLPMTMAGMNMGFPQFGGPFGGMGMDPQMAFMMAQQYQNQNYGQDGGGYMWSGPTDADAGQGQQMGQGSMAYGGPGMWQVQQGGHGGQGGQGQGHHWQ